MASTLRALERLFFGMTAQMALQMFRTPKSTVTDGALNLASACSLFESVSTGVLICALLTIHGVPSRGSNVGWKIPRVRMVSLSLREHGGSSGCIRTRCGISEATRSSCNARKGGGKPENWGWRGRVGLGYMDISCKIARMVSCRSARGG